LEKFINSIFSWVEDCKLFLFFASVVAKSPARDAGNKLEIKEIVSSKKSGRADGNILIILFEEICEDETDCLFFLN